MLLLLFESPAGYALFKLLKKKLLYQVEDLCEEFSTAESARKIVKLKAFSKFENVTEALSETKELVDGRASMNLIEFLDNNARRKSHFRKTGYMLGVAEHDLAFAIAENMDIKCVYNTPILEIMRGLRSIYTELISDLDTQDLTSGLSHSLARYTLGSSPQNSPQKTYNPEADSVTGLTEVSTKKEKKNIEIEEAMDEVPLTDEKRSKKKPMADAEKTAPKLNDKDRKGSHVRRLWSYNPAAESVIGVTKVSTKKEKEKKKQMDENIDADAVKKNKKRKKRKRREEEEAGEKTKNPLAKRVKKKKTGA